MEITVASRILGSDAWLGALPSDTRAALLGAARIRAVDNGAAVYQCSLKPDTSGHIVLGVRARPSKPTLINPNELGIASWAG